MLVMSSLGNPRSLCSVCDPQCSTNCTSAEAETSCISYCDFSPQRDCEIELQSLLGNNGCSDCGALCGTNCSAEVKTSCSDESVAVLRRAVGRVFQQCTANSMCCSSNGTCTCDCNTVAQSRCVGLGDGYTRCEACMRGTSERCYRTCNDDCNNNCKKKGCHQEE
ncbi:hypothetical protein ZWY2020_042171 [Hordeum vulgare]|nr:hypothetical protein ZWY2020_042171 [Hordeum vulgare]